MLRAKTCMVSLDLINFMAFPKRDETALATRLAKQDRRCEEPSKSFFFNFSFCHVMWKEDPRNETTQYTDHASMYLMSHLTWWWKHKADTTRKELCMCTKQTLREKQTLQANCAKVSYNFAATFGMNDWRIWCFVLWSSHATKQSIQNQRMSTVQSFCSNQPYWDALKKEQLREPEEDCS